MTTAASSLVRLRRRLLHILNLVLVRGPRADVVSGSLTEDVRHLLASQRRWTDISDHLVTIYTEAMEMQPALIVELGTRGGESTQALVRAAERAGGHVVSVDIEDCGAVAASPRWTFVHEDDVAFAARFPEWAHERGYPALIDVLFLDTSHTYEHTKQEIAAWLPMLRPDGKVILHDTNLRTWYRRRDGTMGHGWRGRRGVIQAVEDYLDIEIDERRPFTVFVPPWLVRHEPVCNGLTVMRRVPTRPA